MEQAIAFHRIEPIHFLDYIEREVNMQNRNLSIHPTPTQCHPQNIGTMIRALGPHLIPTQQEGNQISVEQKLRSPSVKHLHIRTYSIFLGRGI